MAKQIGREAPQPSSDTSSPTRERLLADTAIAVLAEHGSRGLTHRAVDRAAGLPEGSTSNLFRTRDALLAATLKRQVEREMDVQATMPSPESITSIRVAAGWMAALIEMLTSPENAELVSARYELFLEGRRRPAFQELLDEVRDGFTEMISAVLGQLGLDHDRARSTAILVTLDGLTANQLFHRASALSTAEIERQLTDLLTSFSAV